MLKDVLPPHEREKPPEPTLDDLQSVSAALVGLLEDDIPTEVDKETNTRKFFLAEWLRKQGVEGKILEEEPVLSVPNFYLDPDRVENIQKITDIDDFPVLEPEDVIYVDEGTGSEVYQNKWQQAFLALRVRTRGFGTRMMHLFVQPGHSKWTYSSNKRISTYTVAKDERGIYHPSMAVETRELIETLVSYGTTLRHTSTSTG